MVKRRRCRLLVASRVLLAALATAALQIAASEKVKLSAKVDVLWEKSEVPPASLDLDLETCSPRDREPENTKGSVLGLTRDIGVVLVVCNETLSFLKEVGCQRGRHLHYHVYSVCGVKQEELLTRGLDSISSCMTGYTDVASLVYADLTQTRGHAEFMTHIIQNYEMLDENLVFATAAALASDSSDVLPLSMAITAAKTGEWGYRPLRHRKSPLRFDSPPVSGDKARYGEELCVLYKRFTCERECPLCSASNSGDGSCAYVAKGDAFITSASRVRTLAVRDYNWVREWLQQWQEGEQGALHGHIADRMWSMLLGCAEDMHSPKQFSGCRHSSHFPENGRRLRPPDEFINQGLVHFPPPTFKHDNRHPYPRITSPIYKYSRDITFVVTLGKSLPKSISFGALIQPIFGNIIYNHPSANVILLVHSDVTMRLRLSRNYFAGRLKVMQIESKLVYHMFGVLPPDLDMETEAKEWYSFNWMRNHNFEMRRKFVRMMADGQIVDEFGEEQRTHVVFLNIHSALLGNVWPVFDSDPFDVALPFQPFPRRPFDSSVMFIHRDRLPFAANLMDDVLYNHLLPNPKRSFEEVIRLNYLGCLDDKWFLDNSTRVVSCGNAPVGNVRASGRVHVKLLPAAVWNGVIVKGGDLPAGDFFKHEWATAAAHPEARVIRFLLRDAALGKMHRSLFQAAVTEYDSSKRREAAHMEEDAKYSWGKGAREKMVFEAQKAVVRRPRGLEERTQVDDFPRRRLLEPDTFLPPKPRRQPVRHPRGPVIPQRALSETLHIPDRLFSVNPEEDSIDWDDPFMDFLYEIRSPRQPTAEDYVSPKVPKTPPKPRFPRSLHNRGYISKISALYEKHYVELLRRPSQARDIVTHWGGDIQHYPDARTAGRAADARLASRQRIDATASMSELDRKLVPVDEDGLNVEYLPEGLPTRDVFGRLWSALTSALFPQTVYGRIAT